MTTPASPLRLDLPRAGGFTLEATVHPRRDLAGELPLATISAADGSELARVFLRRSGAAPELRGWDERQQNYANAGATIVLEAVVAIAIDAPYRDGLPRSARVGIPIAGDGPRRLVLRLRPGKLDLLLDGRLADEEWPAGGLAGTATNAEALNGTIDLAVGPERSDAELGISPDYGGPVGTLPAGPQYWHPPGHNRWAGDTMVFHDGERLHLLYLIDRRHHGSKGGCGAHQVAHLSSADLTTWESHPLALPIDAPWEAIGTGSVVKHQGRWWFLYGLHTERMVERPGLEDAGLPRDFADLGGRLPLGTALAVSDDGVHFRKLDRLVHPAQNPSVFPDPAGGFWMLAGEGAYGLYRSEDLQTWTAVDHLVVPYGDSAPRRNTCECMCHLEWNGWHYLFGGFTGFWMSRAFAGPYWDQDDTAGARCVAALSRPGTLNPRPAGTIGRPRWDIYDGLGVPMAVAMPNGRRILAGWLQDLHGWAGCLVLRELHQEADGTLAMAWLPESVPATGAAVALAADGSGLPEECLIELRLVPDPGTARIAVTIGRCELGLDPIRGMAQWCEAPAEGMAPALPGQAEIAATTASRWHPHVAYGARDFAIDGVEDLDRPIRLRVLVIRDHKSGSTILDAEINGRRTLITRRPGVVGGRMRIAAADGMVRTVSHEVRPIQRP